MDDKYVRLLQHRFQNVSAAEIAQEIALAELQAVERGQRLVWCIAERNLLDLEQKRMRYERMFPVGLTENDLPNGDECRLFSSFIDELEWRDIMDRLPVRARKLAQFARMEAERFENVPDGVWRRQNLSELRRRVKRDYIAWDTRHTREAYHETRRILVDAMRRKERSSGRGAYRGTQGGI